MLSVILRRLQIKARLVHLSQKIFLGQRRTLVRPAGFLGDQRDLAVETQTDQFRDDGMTRLAAADHDYFAHEESLPVSAGARMPSIILIAQFETTTGKAIKCRYPLAIDCPTRNS